MKTTIPALAFLLLPISSPAQLAQPNAAGVAMGHVHLLTRNADAQKKFWMEQFGAVELKQPGPSGVKLPGMLILFEAKERSGGSEGTSMDHFGLKVPSLAESLQRVRAAGFQVQREFRGTEGFPNAYIFGPDDVKIELQEDAALKSPAIAYHLHFINAAGDHSKLQDWYAKHFGAVVKKRGSHEAADIPGMNLTFGTSPKPPLIGTRGRSVDHIGFEVKNLKAFCRKLEASGVKIEAGYKKNPSLRSATASLTDPFGTVIELTEGLGRF